MKTLIVVTLLCLGPQSFAHSGHLSYKNNTVHIHANFVADPLVGKEATLVLEAKEAATHQPIELMDKVSVVLWMPSMGHGSAPTQIQATLDPNGNVILGSYTVRNIYFIMGGQWDVRVTLTDANGVSETQIFQWLYRFDFEFH
jgi:hypothetical protein